MSLKSKEELMQEGYKLLGKYSEELFTYYKPSAINGIPGVSYFFVDSNGVVNGGEKFFTKKEIELAANIQRKLAMKQNKIFARVPKKAIKRRKKRNPVKDD